MKHINQELLDSFEAMEMEGDFFDPDLEIEAIGSLEALSDQSYLFITDEELDFNEE